MQRTPTLAVIIPTLGRSTLTFTLKSVIPQLRAGDELIVVADPWGNYHGASRRTTYAQRQVLNRNCWTTFIAAPSTPEGRGYGQRQAGMKFARGKTSHICFLDDDDVYTPDALDVFRENAEDVPCIFRMEYGSDRVLNKLGTKLWKTKELEFGNVGSPMFLVPNQWGKLGKWKAHTKFGDMHAGGDFTFISQTVEKMGGVEWLDHVVALIRPTFQ